MQKLAKTNEEHLKLILGKCGLYWENARGECLVCLL